MLTPDNSGAMPSQPIQEGVQLPQRKGFTDVLRCIGCILSRDDEGAAITSPTIETCTGLDHNTVYRQLEGMEKANLLEVFTPNEFVRPLGGRWKIREARHLQPTELGATLLPVQPQAECPMRNPLIRLTSTQERAIRCARCVLAKSERGEGPTANGVLVKQVTTCQDIPRRSVAKALDMLVDGGLMRKKSIPRTDGDRGQRPSLYTLTPGGAIWISPEPASRCSGPKLESLLLKGYNAEQQKILGCIACIHRVRNSDGSPDRLRQVTVSRCQNMPTGTVDATFRKLIHNGHLEKVPLPGTRRTDHYLPTEAGERLLDSMRTTAECPSGKVKPMRGSRGLSDPDEERRLAKESPSTIIDNFPTVTFENGAQLLEHLSSTYYGTTTQLDLVVKAITNSLRRRLRVDGPVQAPDVLQEVLIGLAKMEHTITFPDGMRIVWGIVSNQIANAYRKLSKAPPASSLDALEDHQIKAQDNFESDLVSQMDARHILEELIRDIKLSPLERAIIGTMAFGGSASRSDSVDAQTLASQYETTESNVWVVKSRLFKRLREHRDLRSKWEEV